VRLVVFGKMPSQLVLEEVDRMITIWYIIIAPCGTFLRNLMQVLIVVITVRLI